MSDYDFGKHQEAELFSRIKNKFGEGLKQNEDRYALFDFNDDTTFIELKSRRCKHDTYTDTMIGLNKVNFAINNPACECIFLFNFTDGIYYFKHSADYNYIKRFAGRKDRFRDERKTYAFIPKEHLLCFDTD